MTKSICHSFLETSRHPQTQEAIRFKKSGIWNSLSWADYASFVHRFAAALHQNGIVKGSRVAIWSNTRPEWAMADMAILSLGAVVIPIYQSSLPEDIVYILNNSKSEILICENPVAFDKWKKIQTQCPGIKSVICFDADASTQTYTSFKDNLKTGEAAIASGFGSLAQLVEKITPTDLATLVYTSGTTGQPKGVMITHEQIMSEIPDVVNRVQLVADDRSLTFLPFAHVFGRIEHWAHVHAGFAMAYAESIDRIRDNLREVSPTFLVAVPRIFEKIYNGIISQADINPAKQRVFEFAMNVGRKVSQYRVEGRSLSIVTQFEYQLAKKLVFDKLSERMGGRLRFAFCGGAPLSPDIARFFHAAGLLIIEGYGLTETTAAIAVNPPNDYRFGTVGRPLGDAVIKIAEDGEILVKSKKVMTGYLDNEDATREVMTADGFFCTGDIGELTGDGFLKITDRKKDLIKTAGGKYVAPQRLENFLKLNKHIANVLIHGDRKKYVVALITLNPDELKSFASARGLTETDPEKLVKDPKVRELVRGIIAETNSKLASYESIKNFAILPHDFTIEAGELTPSLKVKRRFCDQKYAATINQLYGDEASSKSESAART